MNKIVEPPELKRAETKYEKAVQETLRWYATQLLELETGAAQGACCGMIANIGEAMSAFTIEYAWEYIKARHETLTTTPRNPSLVGELFYASFVNAAKAKVEELKEKYK